MRNLNMKSAIKKYNSIMETLEHYNKTIGTELSKDTDDWNIRDMVAECDYELSCYYLNGNINGKLGYADYPEKRKMWKSVTEKLKNFIGFYEPFINGVKCVTEHCSKYDNKETKKYNMKGDTKKKIDAICSEYKYDSQSRQCIEEMAELTQAINKFWRKRLKSGEVDISEVPFGTKEENDIVSEIADVQIMLWQMENYLICNESVKSEIDKKINRQIVRIKYKNETAFHDYVNEYAQRHCMTVDDVLEIESIYNLFRKEKVFFIIDKKELTLDKNLTGYDEFSIFFVCKSGQDYFISLCTDEEKEKYLVAKIELDNLSKMLHEKITMRDLILQSQSFWEITAAGDILNDIVVKKDIKSIPLDELPYEGAYFKLATKDLKEYAKEIDKTIAKELWIEFGNVPMNPETEDIEEEWNGFSAGTHREDIWHWFEETYNVIVAEDLMGL